MSYEIKDYFNVEGKKCIVTGGAQGLSRGMAEGLLENGAEVVLMDRQEDKLKKVVDEYTKKGYKAYAVVGDLSKKEEIDRMFDEAMEFLGDELNVLIPAAGIQRRHNPWEFPEDEWKLVIDINLNHVWFMIQKAVQKMKDQKVTGKIITIGSMVSWFGGTTVPAYTAAKGAVTQLTKSIASDCASHNICCNGLAPGYMDTEMNVGLTKARRDEISERIPAVRWGLPDDMKGPVLFLASDASNYLNGSMIPVDGGYLVK
ncbi:MAG: SDR family oxidoreductase [Liquorilactobacillus nagelii]|jgi:2-deoxy-D-gluconate 3-dehydrogenase|uniref:2-deoxy-D-gluconate 3-dehydrogenase n=2 Tax=Lactobacillaceae TaxID=33958 RepID=A0A3Q8CMT5_9LACO|nr:SDR family oxidoreductase [Liquorilactobacillus nagelii]AUJ32754.1 2-deoxy-D-gluconate 3-dehydrogenase [Liquorilactobacillus nagelii]MCC7617038.1 2-deoxy-D-gluconate 3-dehydrogenase [Liquorilactobacillus nagelii]MCP9315827.1 SDR family oxidoreductase [Liquorilactobacillus nagelii]